MEITLGYAIVGGGMLLVLALTNLLPLLPQLISFARPFFRRASRYFKYGYLVPRHRLIGPWTFANVITQLVYIGVNTACLGFRFPPIATVGIRAGNLSLINLIPLFLGPHLSFLADLLGVSLSTFRRVHGSAGLMSLCLALFHSLVVFTSRTAFDLRGTRNINAVVAGSSLALIVVLSWPPLRKGFYETFLRMHQFLAAIITGSLLLHVPPTLRPQMYFYISTAGIFVVTLAFEAGLVLYNSGIFTGKMPIVGEIFKYRDGDDDRPVQLTVLLREALNVKPPQFINIWVPSLGIRSFMQSHPFVVTSWTGTKQTSLELLIEPRHGWTRRLQTRAVTASGNSAGLGRVLFSGPHGSPVPVDDYEYIFMVASGYGIIPHLPLLERLVQGTLAREVRARRICLVWEIEDIGLFNVTLAISVFSELKELPAGPIGRRGRAQIIKTPISLIDTFSNEIAEIDNRKKQELQAVTKMEEKRAEEISTVREEISSGKPRAINLGSNEQIYPEYVKEIVPEPETLPVCTRTPRMLITVSGSAQIRDKLRLVLQGRAYSREDKEESKEDREKIRKGRIRTSLNKDISLAELDYQPLG